MKKILTLLAVAVLSVSAVHAAEIEPQISVNGRDLLFRQDQPPVIINDRLYVPVRRVLEEMGAGVEWNGETKTVTVSSYDNIEKLFLTIDSKEIAHYTYTSVLNADKEVITSDVAPVIVGERTMLPIRVIAETLGSDVVWDGDTYSTAIITKQAKNLAAFDKIDTSAEDFSIAEAYRGTVPEISLSSDSKDVKAGDTVTVKLNVTNLDNLEPDTVFNAVIASILYNPDNFSFKDYQVLNRGEAVTPDIIDANPDFMPGCLKIFPLANKENAFMPAEDGTLININFTALNENGGEFALSNGTTELGNNVAIILSSEKSGAFTYANYNELYIDTTPIAVK